jgi:hypothetical protein
MLTALTLGAILLIQSPAPAAQAAPAGITLDFIATGPDGQPVMDLSAADVILKVNGKQRPLTSLERVPSDERGRTILLLVDEATLYALEPVAKEAIAKLVASLKPYDRIGYVSTRTGRISAPSTKHEPVTTAAEAMVTGPGVLQTCLSDLLRSIDILTRTLPRGRSSTLVVLSRGSSYDPTFGTSDAVGCTPRLETLRPVADTVSAAQINLHLLTVDEANRSWALDTLAGNTGGLSGLVTWADTGTLARVVATPSSYYRATFAADEKAPDRPQRVDLRVSRSKVKVLTSPTVQIREAQASKPGSR